jgi:hypothetical protein
MNGDNIRMTPQGKAILRLVALGGDREPDVTRERGLADSAKETSHGRADGGCKNSAAH